MSVDTKKLTKNAYRITKEKGMTALRVRVPGGNITTKELDIIADIADRYGNGRLHITTRQGFEIPGIPISEIEKVNQKIIPLLENLREKAGVNLQDLAQGYPAAGTRNVAACIGSKVCPYGNYDTSQLAREIEGIIYPSDYHVKIALSGCPNDCIKGHLQDIGIMGQVETVYDSKRCISCGACVKNCRKKVTGALYVQNYTVKKDQEKCIGCGECVLACPTGAWTRGKQYYAVVIMGRTGKKNPRLAAPFLRWAEKEAILKIVANLYKYIAAHIDKTLPKEHVGYIVDRTGYNVFKEEVLQGVDPGEKCIVAKNLNFYGYKYNSLII